MGFHGDLMSSFVAELGDCVLLFGETVEIVRALPSPIEHGRRTGRPEEMRFNSMLSVQPVTQSEAQKLPEGLRVSGTVRVFSTCELQTVETSECRVADRFTVEGVTYQVEVVEDWNKTAAYYSCYATRIGQ
jgi:hypothetical protein